MKEMVLAGLLGAGAGAAIKSAIDLVMRSPPGWAARLMSHVRIGGLANEGEKLVVQPLGSGQWEPGQPAAYYLVWRVGPGVRDLQAHVELRAPLPEHPFYILEIYHSWKVPKDALLQTDLPHEVVVETPYLLVVKIPASEARPV